MRYVFWGIKYCAISLTTSWHHIIHKPITKMNDFWLLCSCKSLSVWTQVWHLNKLFCHPQPLNYGLLCDLFCLEVNTALRKAVHQFVFYKLCSFICWPPECFLGTAYTIFNPWLCVFNSELSLLDSSLQSLWLLSLLWEFFFYFLSYLCCSVFPEDLGLHFYVCTGSVVVSVFQYVLFLFQILPHLW